MEGNARRDMAGGHAETNHRQADADEVAASVVTSLHAMEVALAPIVGRLGVGALYHRSLHRCEENYPWMIEGCDDTQSVMDLKALKTTLVKRSSTDAAAGGRELQRHFRDLLTSLVGISLTERLLRPTLVSGTNGAFAPDRTHD